MSSQQKFMLVSFSRNYLRVTTGQECSLFAISFPSFQKRDVSLYCTIYCFLSMEGPLYGRLKKN